MGSYENIIKIEEIKRKVDEGDFISAQKILDTMQLKKIKNVTDLNLIAEVYAENERYEEAEDIYLNVYERTKSRRALFQLINTLIKSNNTNDAEYYLEQYQKIAPKDFYNYVFRYQIDKIKGESYEHLIATLEELKRTEYTEKWTYELAKLYYKAGMEKECVRECSDIELWFGEGTYVEKARILRSTYSDEVDKEKIMEEIKRRAEYITNRSETDYQLPNFSTEEEEMVEDSEKQEDLSEVIEPQKEEDFPEKEESKREQAEPEVEITKNQPMIEESIEEEDRKLDKMMEKFQINAEEMFGNFLHVVSVKKQLIKSLEMIISDDSKNLMMIITGTKSSGKTTLAKDIALFLFKTGKLKSSKLAKITADKLNTIDVLSKKDILSDCCLVVENASELKRSSIVNLMELSEQLNGNLAIIFEDDKKYMYKLFREYPKLMDLLKNRIHLPQYTTEDLMGFACACLKQKDYRIDKQAEQILQNKINQIAKQSEPHRYLEQIYDLMQSAMNAADIRNAVTVNTEDLEIKP